MANTKQTKKRAVQNEKRRQLRASLKSKVRTSIKKVVSSIEGKSREEAVLAYKEAVPVIDKMVGKGIMHKNKAARHKKRLSAKLKKV